MNTEKRPVLCITLYRKAMQPSNFDGILYQLRHWIFSHGLHQKIRFKRNFKKRPKMIFVKSQISSPIVMPKGITIGLEIGLLTKITFWSLLKVPFKGSVEWSRHERHFCSLLPYFLLSWLQILQLCLSFWTSSFDMVLFKKFLQEKEKYPKNLPKRLSS